MAIYSVSYDLNKEGQNYNDLIAEIKSFNDYCKVMDSYWFICSKDTVTTISNRLKKHMDKNDNLLVMEVSTNRQGWLSKKIWNWLKQR